MLSAIPASTSRPTADSHIATRPACESTDCQTVDIIAKTSEVPRVSIGIPVFNGGRYVQTAIESVLTQSFSDFELIISDNASTDSTEDICRFFAKTDSRIRYYRQDENVGAARNFNDVFAHSRAPYFKWLAADDFISPNYLETCLDILDREQSIVLAHSRSRLVDGTGAHIGDYDDLLHFRQSQPFERFQKYLFRPAGMWNAIYGVVRSEVLRAANPHGSYSGADQVLLGELILRGQIHQVRDVLAVRRRHSEQSWRVNPGTKAMAIWLDPGNRSRIVFPQKIRLVTEYFRTIAHVPMSAMNKVLCLAYASSWGLRKIVFHPLMRLIQKAN